MATLPNPLPSLATSGLQLPPGSLVDATIDGTWHEPLLWCADEPASPGTWAALRAAGRPVGLLPVLIDGGRRDQWPDGWDLIPDSTTYPGDHDAEEVLTEYWHDCAPEELDAAEGDWPGLAPVPAAEGQSSPDDLAAEIVDEYVGPGDWYPGARMALVPARRSADIPAAIGWSGPVNFEDDTARLSAVLRSWEDRFGIRVVMLGFDTLTVSVGRPPTTLAEARAVAAEHFAFCPDNIDQNPPYDLDVYAEKSVLNQETWSFWWD
ncbi:DUF4253 domain-containing protein [Streptomyces sp. JV184]|uniref:DUF4253 domain-containing protein n=1 Tax=Streptomyces sp. JV184 TaxID=858637 RepID=UPI002E791653|nr:DUF4253 domain-containing protein [Streptomyces sp. JV184]MEE1744357.1 DUF4253 domain-containing protein [Streptomyces sp. JV184]